MKRKIYLTDIITAHPDWDYMELCAYMEAETVAGCLTPVKASGLNGRRPALYCAYWQQQKQESYEELLEEIKYRLSPLLDISYYQKNPRRYLQDREQILKLSRYLIENSAQLQLAETVNERSFEIFGREKLLDREGGLALLSRLGFSAEKLNCYATSEPMSYYSHTKQTPQNALIIENKDTFYSMRRHLIQGNDKILGLAVGTLIYGGGKAIYKSFEDYVTAVEPYFGAEGNQVWYFGDLDYEGILIYETLREKYRQYTDIRLFTEAYERMLIKAEKTGYDSLPRTKEGQDSSGGAAFFSCFPVERQRTVKELLRSGGYIPQEIVNAGDY